MRLGSAGEPLRWYNSQPPKNGPVTSQRSRFPSAVSTNAPLRVPTSILTPLIRNSFRQIVPPADVGHSRPQMGRLTRLRLLVDQDGHESTSFTKGDRASG